MTSGLAPSVRFLSGERNTAGYAKALPSKPCADAHGCSDISEMDPDAAKMSPLMKLQDKTGISHFEQESKVHTWHRRMKKKTLEFLKRSKNASLLLGLTSVHFTP